MVGVPGWSVVAIFFPSFGFTLVALALIVSAFVTPGIPSVVALFAAAFGTVSVLGRAIAAVVSVVAVFLAGSVVVVSVLLLARFTAFFVATAVLLLAVVLLPVVVPAPAIAATFPAFLTVAVAGGFRRFFYRRFFAEQRFNDAAEQSVFGGLNGSLLFRWLRALL